EVPQGGAAVLGFDDIVGKCPAAPCKNGTFRKSDIASIGRNENQPKLVGLYSLAKLRLADGAQAGSFERTGAGRRDSEHRDAAGVCLSFHGAIIIMRSGRYPEPEGIPGAERRSAKTPARDPS